MANQYVQHITKVKERIMSIYPNYYNEDLSPYAFCTKTVNIKTTMEAFNRYCPANFRVEEVRPAYGCGKPACMWIVEYQLKNDLNEIDDIPELPPKGPELRNIIDMITNLHPTDVNILNKFVYSKDGEKNPDTVTIEYGCCYCDCNMFTDLATFQNSYLRPQKALIDSVKDLSLK